MLFHLQKTAVMYKYYELLTPVAASSSLYWPISWSIILLEKLIDTHLVKQLFAFCSNQKFIIVLTRARHWNSTWANWTQSKRSYSTSLISVSILSSHLSLAHSGALFTSNFPNKILYTFIIFPMQCLSQPPLPRDLIALIKSGDTNHDIPCFTVFSNLLLLRAL